MSLLFCKIFDELDTAPKDLPRFRTSLAEPSSRVAERIGALFEEVKQEYSDVFVASESISLDPDSLRYVVGELQGTVLRVWAALDSTRPVFGHATIGWTATLTDPDGDGVPAPYDLCPTQAAAAPSADGCP